MLGVVLAVLGIIIAARAIFGPLQFPMRVNSPMNAEGWFAVALIALIFVRAASGESPAGTGSIDRRDWVGALTTVAVIAVCFAWNSTDSFLSDDFLIIRHAREYQFNTGILTQAGGDGFFRPVTYLSYALTLPFTGVDPFRWHLIALLLHAATSVLTLVVARQIGLTRFAAGLTAVLFAVNGGRPEVAVWITGRFDLLATMFTLLAIALLFYSIDGSVLFRILSLVAMALGILSKESAYAAPLLLTLLVVLRRPAPWRRQVILLSPYFIVAALLFAYRWALFGGIGGYVNSTGEPQALAVGWLPVVKALGLRLWATLVFPLNWSITPGPLVGIALLIYIAGLMALAFRRANRNDLATALGFIIIAALPPVSQLLIGPDLQKARYLYLPSFGLCLLIAMIVSRFERRWLAGGAICLGSVAMLAHNLGQWSHASSRAEPACQAAASCGRSLATGMPRVLNGVYFFQNGFPECVAMESGGSAVATLRDSPPGEADVGQYQCIFTWDPASDSLRRVR